MQLRMRSWLLTVIMIFECRLPSKLEISWLHNAYPCPLSPEWARPLETACVQKGVWAASPSFQHGSGWATSRAIGARTLETLAIAP